jgi:hypothetical protein
VTGVVSRSVMAAPVHAPMVKNGSALVIARIDAEQLQERFFSLPFLLGVFVQVFLISIFLFGSAEPMNVKVGDPVLNIPVYTMEGVSIPLGSVVSNGFVFILSQECNQCVEAVQAINTRFSDQYYCVVLFISKDLAFTAETGLLNTIDAYLVEEESLLPFNIKVTPSLLGYKDSKLWLAYHGRINLEKSHKIIDLFENGMRKN